MMVDTMMAEENRSEPMEKLFDLSSDLLESSDSVDKIRGIMVKGDALNMETVQFEGICEDIVDLKRRLARVQSWGRAFSQIEFSPDMQAMAKIICDDEVDCFDRDIDTIFY